MFRGDFLFAITLLFLSAIVAALPRSQTDHRQLIARGKYLVERVAMCGDCHTPMNHKGEPVANRWLRGSVIGFKPIHPIPDWADKAPDIAGLPKGWGPAEMERFLETGLNPKGHHADPPMPAYRLSVGDARSVTAYLLSLK